MTNSRRSRTGGRLTPDATCDQVANSVKEEELFERTTRELLVVDLTKSMTIPYLGDHKRLDQHHPTGDDDHDEGDDGHDSQDAKHHVAWTGQFL